MKEIRILFCNSYVFASQHDGIGRVTKILADFFVSKSISCIFCAFHSHLDKYADGYHFFLPNSTSPQADENLNYLINLINREKITHVINQQGCSGDPLNLSSLIFKLKRKIPSLKVISVLHGPLFDTYYHASAVYYPKFSKYNLGLLSKIFDIKIVKVLLVKYMQWKQKPYFSELYDISDAVVTLSKSYTKEYINLVKCDGRKLYALSNPITIPSSASIEKENIVLWVGRISFTHKRTDLMISIWNKLGEINKNWTLHILGEGPDLEELKSMVNRLNLTNVQIHGQVDPTDFYQKGAIICMTSTFEGFPLVLTEAMSNSVVPMAFNSFRALTDIISNGEDGIVVTAFNLDDYANRLKHLMSDVEMRKQMAFLAYKKAQLFKLENVGNNWIELLNNI